MNTKDIEEKIKFKIKKYYPNFKGSHSHQHSLRVRSTAVRMARILKADINVVKIASLMHDIARHREDVSKGKVCHEKEGAKCAKKILSALKLPKNIIDNVVCSISSHRFRSKTVPKTLEAKILFDADKLDSIGAIGIGRAFMFAGEIGAELHNTNSIKHSKQYSKEDTAYREYMFKLRKIKDRMKTALGRKIALNRHKFMKIYFDRFVKEVNGRL